MSERGNNSRPSVEPGVPVDPVKDDDVVMISQENTATSDIDTRQKFSTVLEDLLGQLDKPPFVPCVPKNPLDKECIKIFDIMNQVVARVGEEEGNQSRGVILRNHVLLGDMLMKMGRVYRSQANFNLKSIIDLRARLRSNCCPMDDKLKLQAVVVIERNQDVEVRLADLNKNKKTEMLEKYLQGRTVQVALSPLPDEVVERYRRDPTTSEVFEHGDEHDFTKQLDMSHVATDSFGIMLDSSTEPVVLEEPGPRRSKRIKLTDNESKEFINYSCHSVTRQKKRRKIIQGNQNDGKTVPPTDEVTVPPTDGETVPSTEADAGHHEETSFTAGLGNISKDVENYADVPETNEVYAICAHRVMKTKKKLEEQDLISPCLRNDLGEAYSADDFKEKKKEGSQAIVKKFLATIKIFKEPRITDLVDIEAQELSNKVRNVSDDTADNTYLLKFLETVQQETQGIEANRSPSDENHDSGVESDIDHHQEMVAIPCFSSVNARDSSPEIFHGSPVSIESVDSAYQTQDFGTDCPMTCSHVSQVTTENTQNHNHQDESVRFVSAAAIFRKLCGTGDASEADIARYAYSSLSSLSDNLIAVNYNSVRSEKNEVNQDDDKVKNGLGSECPSVLDSACKLKFSLTPVGKEQLKRYTAVAVDQQASNNKSATFVEDYGEELRDTSLKRKQACNNIRTKSSSDPKSCHADKSTPKNGDLEHQIVRKRRLSFHVQD